MTNPRYADPWISEAAKRHAEELQRLTSQVTSPAFVMPAEFSYSFQAQQAVRSQIQQALAMPPGLASAIERLQDAAKQARLLHDALSALGEPARRIQDELNRWRLQNEQLAPVLTSLHISAAVPAISLEVGLSALLSRATEYHLPETHPLLTDQLVRPYLSTSRFSRRLTSSMSETSDNHERAVLSSTLTVLDNHVVAAAETLGLAIAPPADEDQALPTVRYTALSALVQGLRAGEDLEGGLPLEDILALSPHAQLIAKARRILTLITACNEAARARGAPEVFKPTTRLLRTFGDFPFLVALGTDSLANIVDALYFALYEASGEAGRYWLYVSKDDADAIWHVKHLRSHFRHDIEHGEPGKISKKWSAIADTLQALGCTRLPRSRFECLRLQAALYDEAEGFLVELLNSISEPG